MRTVNDRQTAYAVLHAIETDARNILRQINSDVALAALLEKLKLRDGAIARACAEDGLSLAEASSFTPSELLDFVDFNDSAKLLHSSYDGQKEPTDVTSLAMQIDGLARARKRIAHSRPLRREDLPKALTALEALSKAREFRFDEIRATRKLLKDRPEYVLTLSIPSSKDEKVEENLPVPDYDETGLVGRQHDVKQLGKLLRAPNRPVVSLVGEGGVGKSAVALDALNEIVDDPEMPFKAVVWCSLKTHGFGASGVRQLHHELITTLTPLQTFQEKLGLSVSERIEELIEFLELFPTLLVIDNLETINTGAIRQLVAAIPPSSKILITSRIGLGEFEERYPLGPLARKASTQLLRALADLLNAQSIKQKSQEELDKICERLYDIPLALKWVAGAVANGASITEAMRSRGDLLRYCFDSIYEAFSQDQRQILHAFQAIKRPLSATELQYFADSDDFDASLNSLRMTSMLHAVTIKGTDKTIFSLGDSAADFLQKFHSLDTETYRSFIEKERLLSLNEQRAARDVFHDYNPFRVRVNPKDKDSLIASIYLRRAVDAYKRGERALALAEIAKAKSLYAESVEVYRISAVIFADIGELSKADDDFEVALSLAESHEDDAGLLDCVAGFYLRQLQSRFPEALKFSERAVAADRQPDTLLTLARAQLYVGKYDEVILSAEQVFSSTENVKIKPRSVSIAYGFAVEACKRAAESPANRHDVLALEYVMRGFSFLEAAVQKQLFDWQLATKAVELVGEVSRETGGREDWIAEYRAVLVRARKNRIMFSLARSIDINRLIGQIQRVAVDPSLRDAGEDLVSVIARREVHGVDYQRGLIHRYLEDKNYGFLTLDNGEQIFFHRAALQGATSLTKIEGQAALVKVDEAHTGFGQRRALVVQLFN